MKKSKYSLGVSLLLFGLFLLSPKHVYALTIDAQLSNSTLSVNTTIDQSDKDRFFTDYGSAVKTYYVEVDLNTLENLDADYPYLPDKSTAGYPADFLAYVNALSSYISTRSDSWNVGDALLGGATKYYISVILVGEDGTQAPVASGSIYNELSSLPLHVQIN